MHKSLAVTAFLMNLVVFGASVHEALNWFEKIKLKRLYEPEAAA